MEPTIDFPFSQSIDGGFFHGRQQALQEGGDYPGRWSYRGGHSWRGHDFSMFEMEISWIWVWINTY